MGSNDASRLDTWTERIEAAGLAALAIPLLEVARSLGFLVGQALLIGEPLLEGLTSSNALQEAAEWLGDPGRVDELLARLEAARPAAGELKE